TDITVGDLLKRLDLPLSLEIGPRQAAPVFFGGPVQTDRGFVLHKPAHGYGSSIQLGDIALTTSRDVLQDVAVGKGPDHMLITLGYAGWGAGQLEEELSQNAWLNVAASNEILFDMPPEQRYDAALALLGIDSAAKLSGDAGHACGLAGQRGYRTRDFAGLRLWFEKDRGCHREHAYATCSTA